MSENFAFNAPTYFDFNPQNINEDNDSVEMYFETDHECVIITSSKTCTCDPLATDHECLCSERKTEEAVTCIEEDSVSLVSVEDSKMITEYSTPVTEEILLEVKVFHDQDPRAKLRKSMSTGNLESLQRQHSENIESLSHLNTNSYSFKRNKSVSRERINQLAKPKIHGHGSYVSVAEQVNKFYGTFHKTNNNKEQISFNKTSKPLCSTIPHSPTLGTKHRQRQHQVLSTEEMELFEMEEYKKLQMKPLPLNPKIFQGPMKPVNIYKKPSTVVKPFNLTEYPIKKPEQVPNNNNDLQIQQRPQSARANISTEQHRGPTRPTPFSFEARDKLILKRKEEKINQILEVEKRAREFRAKPLPKKQSTGAVKKSCSLNSLKSAKSEDDSKDHTKTFKAKPPTVLYQKPFQPKKPERSLEITEVCLNTQLRAKDREEYDKKVQEKLDRLAMDKLRREKEQKRLEQEEIAIIRKEAVHAAQPIRQYKEIKVKPSGKVTIPVSPNFRIAKRMNSQNKENLVE